jgi:proteasome lid subunit RPN8/RPN11
MIIIETKVRPLLINEAIEAFPDECCGFMYGTEDLHDKRTITEILVVDNSKEGDKTRRFEISPLDYLRAEQYALDHDLVLLGIYHSHPKHPAIPSEVDRKAAQPFFSYVIVSVLEDKTINIRSWRLDDEQNFQEETIADHQLI